MAVISAPHLSIDICLSFTPSASLVASVQIEDHNLALRYALCFSIVVPRVDIVDMLIEWY
jgi:hypothetical protein